MSIEKKNSADLVSLSGSPIYQHSEERPWAAPEGEEFIEQISGHIEAHLGPVDTVFHEFMSDTVHVDVHVVKPTADFPYVRLVTSGMSDLPMATPDDPRISTHLELMITLPAHWRLDMESFEDERWYWPMRLLKYLARFPHKYGTWLGWGHTIPNGDPAEPYAQGMKFNGAILLPSVNVPEAFHSLVIEGVKTVSFYAVVPLYQAEMDLKLRSGSDELLKRFDKRNVSDIVDLGRPNVAVKRFGLW
nr:suppressor of fused domain protein [Dyella amyloliquefaciens]